MSSDDLRTFTVTGHELGLIISGLHREAQAERVEYRRCHRRNAHPSALGRILARKQTILDLIDRLKGETPAVVTATPEQIAAMFADLEADGYDMLGSTDAEIAASWTLIDRIRRKAS